MIKSPRHKFVYGLHKRKMVPFRWLLVFVLRSPVSFSCFSDKQQHCRSTFLPMSPAFASITISQVSVLSSPVTVDATVVVSSSSVQTFSVSLSNGTSTVSLSVSSSAAVLMSSNSLGTQSPSSSTIVTNRLPLTTHGTVSSSMTTARIISPRATSTGTSTASTSVETTKPSVTDKTKSEFDWTWTVLGIVIGLIVIISVIIVAGIILKRRGSAEFGKNVAHEMTAAQIENALASSNPVEVET